MEKNIYIVLYLGKIQADGEFYARISVLPYLDSTDNIERYIKISLYPAKIFVHKILRIWTIPIEKIERELNLCNDRYYCSAIKPYWAEYLNVACCTYMCCIYNESIANTSTLHNMFQPFRDKKKCVDLLKILYIYLPFLKSFNLC